MKTVRDAIVGHPLAWVLLAAAWVATVLVGGNLGLYPLVGVSLLSGVVGAVALPAHPFRASIVVTALAILAAGIVAAVALATGLALPAEGETVGSSLLELPFWLTVFGVPAVVVGLFGGVLVVWFRNAGGSKPGAQPS
jgi:hypothetical protein